MLQIKEVQVPIFADPFHSPGELGSADLDHLAARIFLSRRYGEDADQQDTEKLHIDAVGKKVSLK